MHVQPIHYLVQNSTHSDNVTAVVINEPYQRLSITAQVSVPEKDGRCAIQVFNAETHRKLKCAFDRLLTAGKAGSFGKISEIDVHRRQFEVTESLL